MPIIYQDGAVVIRVTDVGAATTVIAFSSKGLLTEPAPLWNEYLSPQDIHTGLMAKTFATNSSYGFVGASRSRRQQPFGDAERTLMAMLAPHFRRAAEIGRALEVERRSYDARMWIGGAVGLVIVDAARRILSLDAMADTILDSPGCGLRRQGGRLEIRAGSAARLAGLVRQACRTGADPSQVGGGEMVAKADPHIEGAVDVLLSIAPAMDRHRSAFTEPAAVIAMRALSTALPTGFAATVAEALNLTAKEAQVCALLAAGRSLQETATSERISIATARSHLIKIFRKTGTHQQSTLVALLRTIEPLVRVR